MKWWLLAIVVGVALLVTVAAQVAYRVVDVVPAMEGTVRPAPSPDALKLGPGEAAVRVPARGVPQIGAGRNVRTHHRPAFIAEDPS